MDAQQLSEMVLSRLANLDRRMLRIETSLNCILKLFGQPTVELEDDEKPDIVDRSNTVSLRNYLKTGEKSAQAITDNSKESNIDSNSPAEDSNTLFTYQPISSANNQIRVLALHASSDPSSPISASLSIQSFDEQAYIATSTWKPYSALSYTWGEAIFDSFITLDGKRFAITASLETALRAMRARSMEPTISAMTAWPHDGRTPSYWWVDQICINQSDVDERNEQVALMRRIYKRASSVQVWLGPEGEDSDIAMDLIQTLGATPIRQPGEMEIDYPSHDDAKIERHWYALERLLKRPWWERVWIRQEVALSSYVIIVCGSKSVSLDTLSVAMHAMRYIELIGYTHMPPLSRTDGQSTVHDLDQSNWPYDASDEKALHKDKSISLAISLPWTFHAHSVLSLHRSTHGGSTFVDLQPQLLAARSCEATDPRDVVYSTLGLIDTEVYLLSADYHRELKEVLMSATAAVLPKENGLDVLGGCQNVERKRGLPSWVVNASEMWRAMPLPTMQIGLHGSESHSFEIMVQDRGTGYVHVEGERLTLRGGLVDEIAMICANIVVHSHATDEELDTAFIAWKAFASGAARAKRLSIYDNEDYVVGEETRINWIRFLTIFQDNAKDLQLSAHERWERDNKRSRKKSSKGTEIASKRGPSKNEILQTAEELLHRTTNDSRRLNLKLVRKCLLPDNHEYFIHSNRRIHIGMRKYGPGRRLAITARGFLCLIPAEAVIGDAVAIFEGATFPYVLRKHSGKNGHLLVGEVFVPGWTVRRGEEFAKDEWHRSLTNMIRID